MRRRTWGPVTASLIWQPLGAGSPVRADQGVQADGVTEPGPGHVDHDGRAGAADGMEQGRPQLAGVGDVDLLGGGHDGRAAGDAGERTALQERTPTRRRGGATSSRHHGVRFDWGHLKPPGWAKWRRPNHSLTTSAWNPAVAGPGIALEQVDRVMAYGSAPAITPPGRQAMRQARVA